MKIANLLFFKIILLSFISAFGQTNNKKINVANYDSLTIQIFDDYSNQIDLITGKSTDTIIITGNSTINSKDAERLIKKINQKKSYGQSQASTPVYDLKLSFHKNDTVKEEVLISLWTNNLFASFPLKVQRQGDCMCEGEGGYCCSKGGISDKFKRYLHNLLEKYNLSNEMLKEIK
ncbi:MAG: hypothetical protein RQ875_14070 [Vicingaceae bacterium]|nr:hypothetical protein [Vicingaceae bacterium]